jgi:hypothetical protein
MMTSRARKTPKRKNGHLNGTANARLYQALLKASKDNPLRLFNVKDIRLLFHIPDRAMRHYRRLSEQEPSTDPWQGDRTSVGKFDGWYWNVRVRLEKEFPRTP